MTFKSSVLNIRVDCRLFSILNFPGAAILDFTTSYGYRYCEVSRSSFVWNNRATE